MFETFTKVYFYFEFDQKSGRFFGIRHNITFYINVHRFYFIEQEHIQLIIVVGMYIGFYQK